MKRKINRDVDTPSQRRNGQGNPNQRRQGCSFSPDTTIATQDGDKPIAEAEVGDLVMGYSEVAGAVSFMHVTATHSEYHETALDVTIDGEVVHTTDEHPFFVIKDGEGEWVKAKDLQVSDVIFNTMTKNGIVEAVVIVDEPQMMYNLTVQLVASYFVGDGQWLVHNVERPMFAEWGTTFDIAFGVDEHLFQFASSFSDPFAYSYEYWPDELIRETPEILKQGQKASGFLNFRKTAGNANLRRNLLTVFDRIKIGEVPDTTLRFNLQGLTNPDVDTLTMFELKHVRNNSELHTITRYYEQKGEELKGTELEKKLNYLCSIK